MYHASTQSVEKRILVLGKVEFSHDIWESLMAGFGRLVVVSDPPVPTMLRYHRYLP